ncbi:MAG: hypothetical protein LZ174_09200 [Thaumarchaeota archaeon]|nr:hypothetical protein [Candidatus Geocrenenecus arthurdayi]
MERVRIINLTPHELNIYDSEGKIILSIPPKDTPIPRVSIKSEVVGTIEAVEGVRIPVRRVVYGDVENIPPEREGTIYVVSTLVTLALRERGIMRRDLLSPDTNMDSVIRDSSGRVLGVKYLQTVW